MLGAGNVATSLAPALDRVGRVVQVYSRDLSHAECLAARCEKALAINDLSLVDPTADWVVVSVPDDAIAAVVDGSPATDAIWLHTSGSTDIDVFAGRRARYGVLDPVQSFSRQLVTDLSQVHLFVEGSSREMSDRVAALARALSPHVHEATSEQRRVIHIASVFACNFANLMWTLSSEVMERHGLPFKALLPLVRGTVDKLDKLTPRESQTGPASRHDMGVIAAHLKRLDGDKREIYDLLSRAIIKRTTPTEK